MTERVLPNKWPLAPHVHYLEASIIREILKFSSQPGVISFAGGLPSPQLFPIDLLKKVAGDVLEQYGAASVQYSLSRGIIPLRELLAERATAAGTPTTPDNLLVTSGSQQGIELLARAFIDPGDYVLTENPTYLGALQAFNYYQARYVTVEMDEKGMLVDQMEDRIKQYNPKLIYTVSNFQNPTGISLSEDRRIRLCELAARYNIPVVDDNPYGEIQFAGKQLPTVKSFGADEVITLKTFSKTLTPGLRIGWMNGPKWIINQFEKVKQCADLHTSTFGQYLAYEFVKQGLLEPHVEKIKADYRAKRDRMLKKMEETFPEGITWTTPDGGMFLWVKLPEEVSAKELFPKAVEQKVAYVPGQPFYPHGEGQNTLRLNFSNATLEEIDEGIARLGKLFAETIG
ncbi:aminotransferase class I/II-fold pyridoxal phosphate-dependent enzyme [candidate division GN15 bacterium]|nr:aminotransferase class I/II-fold pyridoxal phosphate-dependent enzyme [candidate division GN15 bacterium]